MTHLKLISITSFIHNFHYYKHLQILTHVRVQVNCIFLIFRTEYPAVLVRVSHCALIFLEQLWLAIFWINKYFQNTLTRILFIKFQLGEMTSRAYAFKMYER